MGRAGFGSGVFSADCSSPSGIHIPINTSAFSLFTPPKAKTLPRYLTYMHPEVKERIDLNDKLSDGNITYPRKHNQE